MTDTLHGNAGCGTKALKSRKKRNSPSYRYVSAAAVVYASQCVNVHLLIDGVIRHATVVSAGLATAGQAVVLLLLPFAPALATSGCKSGSATTVMGAGAETHFLAACDVSCPRSLECICGRCTQACDENAD